ncbi:MAG: hypothetical protein MHMPM18_000502 [Marteilia pararefringens]
MTGGSNEKRISSHNHHQTPKTATNLPNTSGTTDMKWMYKGEELSAEDLMLGRKRFTSIDQIADSNTKESKIHQQAKIEMWIKKHEDPLYQICNNERLARRKLLENPYKLRELQEKLKVNSNIENQTRDGNQEKDDEADELARKYLEIIEKKNLAKKSNNLDKLKEKNRKTNSYNSSVSKSKNLDKEERDRKIEEMKNAAKKRNIDRSKHVENYNASRQREKLELQKDSKITSTIINKMAETSDLSAMIKRNRFRNQRKF